jgi:hypothetical protein
MNGTLNAYKGKIKIPVSCGLTNFLLYLFNSRVTFFSMDVESSDPSV